MVAAGFAAGRERAGQRGDAGIAGAASGVGVRRGGRRQEQSSCQRCDGHSDFHVEVSWLCLLLSATG